MGCHGTDHKSWKLSSYSVTFEIICLLCILVWASSEAKPLQMPAMARKAGGSWKSETTQQLISTTTDKTETFEIHEELEESANSGDEDDDSYYDENYSSEEFRCPLGTFYFIRSRKCVPNQCRGGNRFRMVDGSCVPEHIVEYAMERRLYPGRFQSNYYAARAVNRNRGPFASQTRHMTFMGKMKG